jgi:16S rRNA processing protein RimM
LSFRVGPDGAAYIGLRGIPDRNAAELFRGKKIEGEREDAPELEEGRYYIVDIIGLSCETEEGEVLGVVTNITNLSSDVYTIEKAGKSILFPAVKGVIVKYDLANGKLIVNKTIFDEIAVY